VKTLEPRTGVGGARAPAAVKATAAPAGPAVLAVRQPIAWPVAAAGVPLGARDRAFFEPRLGRTLEDVRLHDGEAAARTARALGADAFTVGRDVYFGQGRYDGARRSHRALLAHELVHTAQQAGRVAPRVQRRITVANAGATTPPHTQTNGALVVGLFDELCRDTRWRLVQPAPPSTAPGATPSTAPPGDPEILPVTPNFCTTVAGTRTTGTSCDCVCGFTSPSGPNVEIQINTTDDDTVPTSPGNFRIRLRGLADTGIPGFATATAPAGRPVQTVSDPAWLILGHELCGHAGVTSPNLQQPGNVVSFYHEGSAGWDSSAIDIENRIRREHSAARGVDLGVRAGEFITLEGIHQGSVVALPRAMTLMTLMAELGVPVSTHRPRCPGANLFQTCGSTAPLRAIPILDRVTFRQNANQEIGQGCLTRSFAAGTNFGVEGVFWHLAPGTETKAAIASRYGADLPALDRANRLFANGVDGLAATALVPANTQVVIPYKRAAGATRYFFQSSPDDCANL
jgi:hypothetical protein